MQLRDLDQGVLHATHLVPRRHEDALRQVQQGIQEQVGPEASS